MIGTAIETGQRNMAVLEQAVIKDNTLLPGEWYRRAIASTAFGLGCWRTKDLHNRLDGG
jgi:hypothetical protein